jgi:hypothetical protein
MGAGAGIKAHRFKLRGIERIDEAPERGLGGLVDHAARAIASSSDVALPLA